MRGTAVAPVQCSVWLAITGKHRRDSFTVRLTILRRPKEPTQETLRRDVVESEHRLSGERRRPKHPTGKVRRMAQPNFKRVAQLRPQRAEKLVAPLGVERCFAPHRRPG